MPPTNLPDPTWDAAHATCLACGYSLAGVTLPARCPECGLPHAAQQFILHGVPTIRSITSKSRFALWFFAISGLLVSVQGAGLAIAARLVIPCAAVFLLSLGGCLALMLTGKRTKGGSSRIILTDGRIWVIPLNTPSTTDQPAPSIVLEPTDRLTIRRVSKVWATLTIERSAQGAIFKAGVRLPPEAAPVLEAAFRDNLQLGHVIDAARAGPTPHP